MTKVQNSKPYGKMEAMLLGVVLLVLFLITIFYFTKIWELEDKNAPRVCFKEKCFQVEIADMPEERMTGLMGRHRLDSNSGMLFVFEKEDGYGFWMKNTLISLDIIWIDAEGKIVFIKNNALPCRTESCETFYPYKKAKYVLEINGGLSGEIGLKAGDEMKIE